MLTIAIDGGPATGKGTLGEKLSHAYKLAYLDTGALYRTIGYAVLEKGGNPENEQDAIDAARHLPADKLLEIQQNPAIRTEVYGTAASKVSVFPEVRNILFQFQRSFATNPPALADGAPAKGAVIDGRDIGTKICPDADLKVYLTARPEIRATRRFKELQSKGLCVIYEDVLSEIEKRDQRDRERTVAPLRPADDAFILDTSDLTPEQVFDAVTKELEKRVATKK